MSGSGETRAAATASTAGDRAVVRVVMLTVVLMAGAVALLVRLDWRTPPLLAGPWWAFIAIFVAFGLVERFPFHVEYRREALAFTLSEVPTVMALAFLGPLAAVGARVVASVAVMGPASRRKPYKLCFNGALFAFEVALAFTVVRLAVNANDFAGSRFLIAAAIGTALATLVGSLVVSVVISFFEGDLAGQIADAMRTTGFLAFIAGSVGAVATAPALFGFETVAVSVIPVVSIWMILLRLGRLGQHHRDLESLHGFAATVGQSLDPDAVASAALDEALLLIRAGSGMIQVYDPDGDVIVVSTVGSELPPAPIGPHDPRWSSALTREHAKHIPADFDWGGDEMAIARRNTIVAPIRDDRGILGCLILTDRQGVSDRFDEHDLTRTTTLAAHLATSLRKTLLHASMQHAALHDALTGHLNRAAFDQAVTARLGQHDPTSCCAVLMLDLDKFKDVNDTLGHHVGDAVLVEFARRVDQLLSPDDVFARFGGDEFAIFVSRPTLTNIRELADQILSDSYSPVQLDDLDLVVPVSVGIAAVTDDDRDATAPLRRADIAMYTAKRQHGGCELYREEIDRRTPERLSLLGDLREALETGSIAAHYQPKIDLVTSTVTGFEALARWHHPIRGVVPPDEFIPVAEETGLIKGLTDHILTTALQAMRGWQDAGLDLRVAVNLSTLDLLDELLAERIAHRLEEHGVDADRLTLEITESSLMADTPRTMATVTQLHQLGITLSLDDFGTGYSSLSYLRRLPVSELKIDRSFVANILLEPQDEMIVRSTIDLGHNLGLHVAAEGIETNEVLNHLASLGCDIGQGYGISRPLPLEQVDTWLATTEHDVEVITLV